MELVERPAFAPAEKQAPALRPDLLAVAELIRPGEKVLDLGCEDGRLLRYLIDTRRVVGRGVELAEAGVLASMRAGLSVRQGNLQEGLGDYPDGAFDTVILSYTIPYLNDPAFIIREMLRVGRRAVVSFPNWGHWRSRLSFLLSGRAPATAALPQAWDGGPRARAMTVADFLDFCAAQGFRPVQEIYLQGGQRIPARFDKNIRATTAIFELK